MCLQDALPPKELEPAETHCKEADVVLCLGTRYFTIYMCMLPTFHNSHSFATNLFPIQALLLVKMCTNTMFQL